MDKDNTLETVEPNWFTEAAIGTRKLLDDGVANNGGFFRQTWKLFKSATKIAGTGVATVGSGITITNELLDKTEVGKAINNLTFINSFSPNSVGKMVDATAKDATNLYIYTKGKFDD